VTPVTSGKKILDFVQAFAKPLRNRHIDSCVVWNGTGGNLGARNIRTPVQRLHRQMDGVVALPIAGVLVSSGP
jgi:hypothetical protein